MVSREIAYIGEKYNRENCSEREICGLMESIKWDR
jgi:hypothetical protein